MRVACLSDLHGELPEVARFDTAEAIILAGDIGPDRWQDNWLNNAFTRWCHEVQVPVHLTWGNHDFPHTCKFLRQPANLFVHVAQSITLGGERVWFSPYVPTIEGGSRAWAWCANEAQLADLYRQVPHATTVIVSHGPPRGAGDLSQRGRCGSLALARAVKRLPNLRHVICGHIHEDFGTHKLGRVLVHNVSGASRVVTWFEF